jgi:hypothetical protein
MAEPEEPELLTIAEVAKVLRMSTDSIYQAIKEGTFPIPVFLISRVMLNRHVGLTDPAVDPAVLVSEARRRDLEARIASTERELARLRDELAALVRDSP